MAASPQKTEWFVCPDCTGEGVRIQSDPRAPWRRRKELCARCGGNRMVQMPTESREALACAPVRRCAKCLNWYAIGAGHPASETNDPLAVAPNPNAHSHWHDLSFYKPPGFKDEPVPASVTNTVDPEFSRWAKTAWPKRKAKVAKREREKAAQKQSAVPALSGKS